MRNLFKNKIFPVIALILLFIILWVISTPKIKVPLVIGTDPKNEEQEVSETKQIDINFSSDLSEKAKKDISVSIDPQVTNEATWLNTTYKIIPKSNLTNNTKYTVKVSYKNKDIYSLSFTTQVFSKEDIQKYGPLQSKDDYDYGQALNKVIEKYPFYPNLPIRTSDFTIYYDFDKNKFSIDLLKDNLDKATKQDLINQALEYIRKIGAKDPIDYYIFTPAP